MSLTSNRHPLGQLVFCQGCCCGRTDRGRPELPVERLKEAWKAEKLNKTVQLTISGCLGPCDLPNVTLVITADGNRWYGNLAGDAVYETLIGWARECHTAGAVVPFPESLAEFRFDPFAAARTTTTPT